MTRLPNFLIVGAMKCGTTSLASWLREHPDVFIPETKEIHFFSNDDWWGLGPEWYAEHFRGGETASAVGEATPAYMFFPWAVDRIEELLPEVRVIACLRDPVHRTYSHYLHWREREVLERRDFLQAVRDELAEGEQIVRDRRDTDPPYFGYLPRGRYLPQLQRLADRFGRDRLHVVLLDDLEADPAGSFAGVCRFLGVDDAVVPVNLGRRENAYHTFRPAWLFRYMVHHDLFSLMPARVATWLALDVMTPKVKPVPPMDPEAQRLLAQYFAEANAQLAEWLGRDLHGWTTA